MQYSGKQRQTTSLCPQEKDRTIDRDRIQPWRKTQRMDTPQVPTRFEQKEVRCTTDKSK